MTEVPSESAPLPDGDETRISHPRSDRVEGPREASLVQIYGPNLGQRYVLHKEAFTIGRDSKSDVVLDTDNVSRNHARITLTGDRVVFEDLGSTNGSLVNDAETRQCILANGDVIKVGSVMLKFISSGNAEALYHEEIYRMTIQDGLTGVPNRRYFSDFLDRELARARRYQRPLALAMFDIDHFKRINDSYGHNAGDKALKIVGQMMQSYVRQSDCVFRIGGEEFVLLLSSTDVNSASRMVENMRKGIAASSFHFKGEPVRLTLSAGITETREGDSIESIYERADAALYKAKHSGRNCQFIAD